LLLATIKIYFISFSVLLLTSCTIIDPLGLASVLVDGVVQAKTGKSVVDNVVSTIAESDCRVFRVINKEKICKDDELDDNKLDE
jgi:hypothetical protein